jgi:hypothetical protein
VNTLMNHPVAHRLWTSHLFGSRSSGVVVSHCLNCGSLTKRTLFAVVLLACWSLPCRAMAQAQVIQVTKDIGWTFVSKPETLAAKQGTCAWNLTAYADCQHFDENRGKDIDSHSWPANAAHAAHTQRAQATVGDAWGLAERTYSANAPVIIGQLGSGFNRYRTDMHVGPNIDGGVPKDGVWQAHGSGKMKLSSGDETRAALQGVNNTVNLNWTTRGHSSQVTRGAISSYVRDPISVEVVELETATTYVEDLFGFNISADGMTDSYSWNWDSAGILLETPRGTEGAIEGSVMIDGQSVSSWLVNPIGSFGVSLAGGVFSASGAWANLPWQVTYDQGAAVSAFLPGADLASLELNYVIPDSILRDGFTYSHALIESTSLDATGAAPIPEPAEATLLLLGTFGWVTARRWRKDVGRSF